MDDFIILGAGIAGLTAARELLRQGQRVTLIEKGREVGGLARTFEREGFRFDLGGHRFHSNNPSVLHWLHELMGEDLLRVPRVSHIKLNGRFVTYPIAFPNAFTAFSPLKATQLAASYALAHLTERGRPDHSFEDWIVKRFGSMMYQHFFQPYTEKVWGVSGQQLAAEWAAARIGLPNMWQAIRHTLRPSMNPPATAIDQFYYPRYGFGTIPQALARDIVAHGGRILTETTPGCIQPGRNGFELLGKTPSGSLRLRARELVSTIPLDQLLGMLPQNGRFIIPSHRCRLCGRHQFTQRVVCFAHASFTSSKCSGHDTSFGGKGTSGRWQGEHFSLGANDKLVPKPHQSLGSSPQPE
ncbi:MAG: FAD-dependent oxidoreductase [Anaerolineales bacterium]|nr:FAD-dependent oxidoreductase [Anaerolineales bacterium]